MYVERSLTSIAALAPLILACSPSSDLLSSMPSSDAAVEPGQQDGSTGVGSEGDAAGGADAPVTGTGKVGQVAFIEGIHIASSNKLTVFFRDRPSEVVYDPARGRRLRRQAMPPGGYIVERPTRDLSPRGRHHVREPGRIGWASHRAE
jgi:hypothetical protein